MPQTSVAFWPPSAMLVCAVLVRRVGAGAEPAGDLLGLEALRVLAEGIGLARVLVLAIRDLRVDSCSCKGLGHLRLINLTPRSGLRAFSRLYERDAPVSFRAPPRGLGVAMKIHTLPCSKISKRKKELGENRWTVDGLFSDVMNVEVP